MCNWALWVLLCALTAAPAIAADALQPASVQASIRHSDASVFDGLEAASGEDSPAVVDGTVTFKTANSSSNNSLLPRLIPLQLLLSPARFRLPQVRQCYWCTLSRHIGTDAVATAVGWFVGQAAGWQQLSAFCGRLQAGRKSHFGRLAERIIVCPA